jgi:hypothetical protein
MRLNCITVNTDASFCFQTKASAWAFSIVSDVFVIKNSGLFKESPGSSINAEALCIGNALTKVLKACGEQYTAKYIVLNTDCKTVERVIEKARNNESLVKVRSIVGKVSLSLKPEKFEFRHVKSHTDNTDRRSKANEWCDITCKTLMKSERHKRLKNRTATWKNSNKK